MKRNGLPDHPSKILTFWQRWEETYIEIVICLGGKTRHHELAPPEWPWKLYCKVFGHTEMLEMDNTSVVCLCCNSLLRELRPGDPRRCLSLRDDPAGGSCRRCTKPYGHKGDCNFWPHDECNCRPTTGNMPGEWGEILTAACPIHDKEVCP